MIKIRNIKKEFENSSKNELVKERNKLLRNIQDYEKERLKKEKGETEVSYTIILPSPKTIYYWMNHELIELTKLIMNLEEDKMFD